VEFRLMANEIKQCIMELEGELAALLHAHPPAPDLIAQIRALPRNAHTITRNDGLTWKIEYVAWADLAALLPPEDGITPKSCGCCALGPCPEHRPTFPGGHNFDNPPGEI
jgi:hypothetical protein